MAVQYYCIAIKSNSSFQIFIRRWKKFIGLFFWFDIDIEIEDGYGISEIPICNEFAT